MRRQRCKGQSEMHFFAVHGRLAKLGDDALLYCGCCGLRVSSCVAGVLCKGFLEFALANSQD